MNEAIISAWNAAVPPDALVLHLGDFAFAKKARVARLRSRLNGTIYITAGNHDASVSGLEEAGFRACVELSVSFRDITILARHDPAKFSSTADVLLYGHMHGLRPDWIPNNAIDVSHEALQSAAPVPLAQVL